MKKCNTKKSIDCLGLDKITNFALKRAGIETLGQLASVPIYSIAKIEGIGAKGFVDIFEKTLDICVADNMRRW